MISLAKTVPLVGDYDVVVCGGGTSGWVAAVAAARSGCRTAIVERYGFFGGTATGGLVVPISAFFKDGQRVVGGIPWEFVERLVELGAAIVELPKGHISVDPEYYKLLSQRMLMEAGVECYTNSYISDIIKKDSSIDAVAFENKNGTEAIRGKIFIDATGDGDVLYRAGAPMLCPAQVQPMSFCFELTGLDCTTDLLKSSIHHDGKSGHSVNMEINRFLRQAHEEANGPEFGGPWFNTLVKGDRIAVNVTRCLSSAIDNRAYSAAEFQLREDMFALVELLRRKYPEFKNCAISSSAVNAGIRESRHLVGEYTIKGSELLQGLDFPDSIARNAHPVDIHVAEAGAQILQETHLSGHIPYRALICHELDNVIAAGRAISADEYAYATTRIQGTVMAIGQAAGAAAALCVTTGTNVHTLDLPRLQSTLLSTGCII